MSTRPFRFMHAGDFHLEQPLGGVAEVPDHLRDLFLESPYTAAKNVFDAALAEDVDFLVLAGDILNLSQTGPRGPLFLVEQCTRLATRGIHVYWAGGKCDPPEVWPNVLPLPENVHVFPQGHVEDVQAARDDEVLARIVGTSRDRNKSVRPADFSSDTTGLYSIGVLHSAGVDASVLQTRSFDYWALGGKHDRGALQGGPNVIHYCGSPQGRSPEEAGIHGCTLVQVDAISGENSSGRTRTSLIPTDCVRWQNERLTVDAATTRDDLEMRLRDRMAALGDASPNTHLMISWSIAGQGPLIAQLRRTKLSTDLLQWLRAEYGHRTPAAWCVSLEVEHAETLLPEWYEQETIRGDFLRAVRQLQMNPDDPLSLDAYLAEAHLAGVLSEAVAFSSPSVRDCVLREAAVLGVDLLSGEDPNA